MHVTGLRTRAVSIAIIWALAVLRALVPALALIHFLSWLAHLGQAVKHIALTASELVRLLIMVAGEVKSAVSWVGVDWMSLEEILWSDNITSGTAEPINLIVDSPITEPGKITSLRLSDTAAHLDIEDKRVGAGELKSSTIIALNILVTNSFIMIIENTIGFLTLRISVRRRFLDKLATTAVNIVGQHTLLVVRDAVIEEKPFWAIFYCGYILPADIEQVALLQISKLAICFRTVKEWSFIPIFLSCDM